MAKSKTKTRGINLPVPQNRDEAATSIRVIGDFQRDLARIEADMNDDIARIKEEAEKKAAPLRAELDGRTEGLKVWAEANRDSITNGNKVKFADLGTGKILWRKRPASVRIKGVDDVIERIGKLGFKAFLRTKTEVNKEAMLADVEKARLVNGVTIGSEGEDFVVEPFEADLTAATAA